MKRPLGVVGYLITVRPGLVRRSDALNLPTAVKGRPIQIPLSRIIRRGNEVHPAAGLVSPGPVSAARYAYLFFAFSWLFFAGFRRLTGRKDAAPARLNWRLALIGAAMIGGGYWPVLWAYQLVQRASYVVACRQFSIVIGVLLAFLIYREKGKFVRITASVLITLGLVVIALWGK